MNRNVDYRRNCEICGLYEENDRLEHEDSEKHRFNYLLYVYNKRKKLKIQDHNGFKFGLTLLSQVEANVTTNETNMLIVKVTPEVFKANSNELLFEVEVNNVEGVLANCEINVLHPHGMFSLESKNSYFIDKGHFCKCAIKFKVGSNIFGSIKLPIGIVITPCQNSVEYFNIFREILIVVSNNPADESYQIDNPFQQDDFSCEFIHPPESNRDHRISGYEIDPEYMKMMYMGLKQWNNINLNEYHLLREVTCLLEGGLTKANYVEFFTYLLWLEEAAAHLGLEQYNMSNVSLKLHRQTEVELEVPGLAEKRPSVLAGDHVTVRVDHTGYTGIVGNVNDKSIFIKSFNEELILILNEAPELKWFVKFELSRLQLVRMHCGVNTAGRSMLKSLFPEKPVNKTKKKAKIEQLYNRTINEEQLKAVVNIASCTSQHAPYIVFGPPGTGKTITIVEAILQIAKMFPKKRILVCAPANAACDMLAKKLHDHKLFNNKELLRLHTTTRDPATILKDIKACSNLVGEDFLTLKAEMLNGYRIIISTLHLIGKFNIGYHPDVLFIDEAAQATEPECDIAISLMKPNDLIVLAGDPKQLGPVCSSRVSERKGLGRSLMERLMETNQLYFKHRIGYDDDFITMLVQNYRSHDQVLRIPNECFYDKALISKARPDKLTDIYISQKAGFDSRKSTYGHSRAVEFCGVLSKEERNGFSPSYFNDLEKEAVIQYVKVLMGLQQFDVVETDIGIIAPYIRQVHKIKQALAALNLKDIEVGTTEAFQGSEKRVMLISTVRAQHSLLKYDRKYQLGFVSNERRFNVALTRAKSKLIIIGNPYCLGYNANWLAYIDYCIDLGSYAGHEYMERTSAIMKTISEKLSLKPGNEQGLMNGEERKRGKKKRR